MNNNVKERPILFSEDMIRALLQEYSMPGQYKNQTRRTLLELEDALTDLEQSSCIIGTRNELTGERKWMITDAGILQLGQI